MKPKAPSDFGQVPSKDTRSSQDVKEWWFSGV